MFYVNKNIKDLYRVDENFSRKEYLRLDMNENPEGLPGEFIEKVLSEITPEFLATYPEKKTLLELLSKYFDVNSEQIELFNGSDEAIRLIFEAFAEPGGKVLASEPTFAMYRVYSKMYGQNYRVINYNSSFELNIEAFIDEIDDKTNLVFALNPNNPIGTVFTQNEIERIIEKSEKCNALVIIDEAYYYFYPNTFINLVPKYNNVIILRTFSKLFSLAACRLGIAISNPYIISVLHKACSSYNVNSIALKFGEAIFQNNFLIDRLVKIQLEGKQYLVKELKKEGYDIIALEGNFIFVKTFCDSHKVAEHLKQEKNILVKSYNGKLLKPYLRISTGTEKIMKLFLKEFLDVDKIEAKC